MNLPWSLCMKVQRDIGVNGEKRELQKAAVNQGGTAERFGPFEGIEMYGGFFVTQQIPHQFLNKKMWGKGPAENERKRRKETWQRKKW